MNIIGTATVNPFLFYSGKFSGYISWILLILCFTGTIHLQIIVSPLLTYISIFCIVTGSIFTITSMVNLGKSTRLGLPSEATEFKNNGIYKISRNPMYVGFNLFTIGSIVGCGNAVVALMGVYSIIIYHLIIKSEERFLEKRFGQTYIEYKKKSDGICKETHMNKLIFLNGAINCGKTTIGNRLLDMCEYIVCVGLAGPSFSRHVDITFQTIDETANTVIKLLQLKRKVSS